MHITMNPVNVIPRVCGSVPRGARQSADQVSVPGAMAAKRGKASTEEEAALKEKYRLLKKVTKVLMK